MLHDYHIYHQLMSGLTATSLCRGHSMSPVYEDGDMIIIHPFTDKRQPQVGDVVHFYTGGGFNRHQIADIVHMNDASKWYRLVTGDGRHDQFVQREHIIGYVVPIDMQRAGIEPKDIYVLPGEHNKWRE